MPMTLLLAAIEEGQIWMIADTAITGELLGPRERVDHLKVERVGVGALAGFACDERSGTEILDGLHQCEPGDAAIRWIVEYQERHSESEVEIAYGWFAEGQPILVKVRAAQVEHQDVFHIGDKNAFDRLQSLRHASEVDLLSEEMSL